VPFLGVLAANRGGDQPGAFFAGMTVTGILLLCCAALFLIVVHFIVHPLYELAVRAIVLEDLHVREGIRRGIEQARENFGGVLVLYLLLIGARIGWAILTLIAAIPFGILFFVVFAAAARSDFNALLILGLIAVIPLILLFGVIEGVFQTFESNVWTEAYLQIQGKTQTATV
jgi:hypothetical protein